MIATLESNQVYQPTFDDLFWHVHRSLMIAAGYDPAADDIDIMKLINACSGQLQHAKEFCEQADVDFEAVKLLLHSAGGACDCEALLNATARLDKDAELPVTW